MSDRSQAGLTGTLLTTNPPGALGSGTCCCETASHIRARIGRSIAERLSMVCLPDSVGSGSSVLVMPRSFSSAVGSGA